MTFTIGGAGPYDGSALPLGSDPIVSVEFGGGELRDQSLFQGIVSVIYADGTTVSGNIHSLSFAGVAGGVTGKIDFSRLPVTQALGVA